MSANGTIAPAQKPKSSSGAAANGCSRCGSTEPWGMSSWCPTCGYYPVVESADEDRMAWRSEVAAGEQFEDSQEATNLLNCIPPWLWVAVAGVMVIFGSSIAAAKKFSVVDDNQSFWAWTELLTGFGIAVAAHGWAAFIAKKSDDRLTFSDVLLNWMAVWQPTITRLPSSAPRIWMFAWGITAMLCSLFVIGGHDTSMFFKQEYEEPESVLPDVVNAVAGAAKKKARKAGSLEEALRGVGNPEEMLPDGVPDGEGLDEALKPAGPELICAIFGVKVDRRGQPTHFLLCGRSKEQMQYVATVKADTLDRPTLKSVIQRLARTNQSRPAVPTAFSAIWVQPKIAMRVEYASIAGDGTLARPKVKVVEQSDWDPNKTQSAAAASSGQYDPYGEMDVEIPYDLNSIIDSIKQIP